jgi:NAD(P)-dependent dehydrogenase (short-subunit alcohol dehydrogenase family)
LAYAYGASKAAIIGLMRNAAIQAGALGITANTIAPGLIDTPGVRYGTTQEQRDAFARSAPLRRLGRDDEVAAMIAFLASPQAAYVTGQTIGVNGGRHMN